MGSIRHHQLRVNEYSVYLPSPREDDGGVPGLLTDQPENKKRHSARVLRVGNLSDGRVRFGGYVTGWWYVRAVEALVLS